MTDITVFRQDVKRLFHDLASESEGEVDSLGKQATLKLQLWMMNLMKHMIKIDKVIYVEHFLKILSFFSLMDFFFRRNQLLLSGSY